MATTDDRIYIAKHHTPNIKVQCEICGEWEIVNGFRVISENEVNLRYKCILTPDNISSHYVLEKGSALPLPARVKKECDCDDGK